MKKNKIKMLVTIVVLIIIDQLIKFICINKNINLILNFLEVRYTENTGMAFGIGQNYTIIIIIIIIINIIILASLGIFIKIKEDKLNQTELILLGIILAGGISNLLDRIFRGYVIDYININLFNFPNFNIADVYIVIGTIILGLFICKQRN